MAGDPRAHRPARPGSRLTRQNVPTFPRGDATAFADTANVARGGYVLLDAEGGAPDVVLIGTGSEVQLAVEAARDQLADEGIRARVVSMPCREWFDEQDKAYRDTVIPPIVKARVSVEAGVAQGWREVVGDYGRIVSLEHFGASADYATPLPASSASPPRPSSRPPRTASRAASAASRLARHQRKDST